ncbi:hypothetical protein [Thauera sp.]|uniref:hypothetical protein n=1 Tax=Thauera sp. TaxID=1905334 RepID=UPI00257CF7B8|nr:hypothetical protein [Thauera sp.]
MLYFPFSETTPFSSPQLVDGLLRGNVECEAERRKLPVVGIEHAGELELITKDRLRDLTTKQLRHLGQCCNILKATVEGECPHARHAHVIDRRELHPVERDRFAGRLVGGFRGNGCATASGQGCCDQCEGREAWFEHGCHIEIVVVSLFHTSPVLQDGNWRRWSTTSRYHSST